MWMANGIYIHYGISPESIVIIYHTFYLELGLRTLVMTSSVTNIVESIYVLDGIANLGKAILSFPFI